MRYVLALALLTTVACKEKQKAPPPPVAKATPVVPTALPGKPGACIEYIVFMKKLEACEATEKAALVAQFDADRDTLSGVKPVPREDLEALCVARAPAVKRVLDACAAGDPRDVPTLEAEVAKAQTAIDAAARVASDSTQSDAARVDAKGKVGALQKQKADLEALIRRKQCLANPSTPGC